MRNKPLRKIAFGLLGGAVIALGSYVAVQAAAYSGTVYGRTTWHGYFTNNLDTSGIEVLPAISGGQAIPSSVNTVSELMALLKAANASSNSQRKTGSAFIVYTMLGLNGANYSRTVSAANWTEITNRLNDRQAKGKISWGGNVSNSINSYYQGGNDAAWYDEYHNEAGIRIYNDDGSIGYELLRRCANPMGRDGKVQEETPDPTEGDGSSVGCQPMLVTVTPGTDYNGNGIPTRVSTSLRSYGPYTSPATINITNPHTTGDIYTVTYTETRKWISGYTQMSRLVKKTINGKVVWVTEYWTRTDYSPARTTTSTIGPCYAYKLIPTVSVTNSGVVEPGASYTVTTSVANGSSGGFASKSKPTDWQVTKMVIEPLATVPPVAANSLTNSAPCSGSVFGRAGVTCTPMTSGNQVFAKSSTTQLTSNLMTAEDVEAGTKFCYALSLKPNASSYPTLSSDGRWIHTAPSPVTSPPPKCLIIGKKPKIQVHGGDLSVGKAFPGAAVGTVSTVNTSTSVKSGNTFGSWVEYGIFATGSITGAASGSGYAGVNGAANTLDCTTRRLSFTNNNNLVQCDSTGKYVSARSIPDVVASFPGSGTVISATSLGPNDSSILSGPGTYIGTRAGSLTLNASTLDPGKTVIIKATGTVTITGDQRYNPNNNGAVSGYTNASQLPQLVIIANKIIIQDNVRNVDAWLIANGSLGVIETCNTGSNTYILVGANKLTSDKCNQPLIVNGPVMAKQLWLRRTAGSGPGPLSGDPAEVFNIRADTYLWAASRASSDGRVQTVYSTELPPRL